MSIPALLPQNVTPPAVVPGGRVVLPLGRMPSVNAAPVKIGPELVDEAHSFFVAQPTRGEFVAVLPRWTSETGSICDVLPISTSSVPAWHYAAACPSPGARGLSPSPEFGPRGEPLTAPRSLERYLVSVDRDRVIVNISRVIESYGATPQPRVSPLATP